METAAIPERTGRYRWAIIGLLFFATTVNYIDRTMLGLLAPTLQTELNWNEDDYGNIVTAFQAAYALGFLFMGYVIDRFGPKIGYSIAITIWTVGHVAHGFGGSVASFMAARAVLGIGEAGHFPAVVRASSEWFPQKERSRSPRRLMLRRARGRIPCLISENIQGDTLQLYMGIVDSISIDRLNHCPCP